MKDTCKNIIDTEDDLNDLIKFYLDEQKKQKDPIDSIHILHELFVILSYNIKKIKNELYKTCLKLKIEDIRYEINQLQSTLPVKKDFLITLDNLDKLLI